MVSHPHVSVGKKIVTSDPLPDRRDESTPQKSTPNPPPQTPESPSPSPDQVRPEVRADGFGRSAPRRPAVPEDALRRRLERWVGRRGSEEETSSGSQGIAAGVVERSVKQF